jgi:hypothetical protein
MWPNLHNHFTMRKIVFFSFFKSFLNVLSPHIVCFFSLFYTFFFVVHFFFVFAGQLTMEAYRVLGRFQAGSEEELDIRSGDIVVRVQNGDVSPLSTLTFVPVHKIYSPEKRGRVPCSLLERIDPMELSGFALDDDFDPVDREHGDRHGDRPGDRPGDRHADRHGGRMRMKGKDSTRRNVSRAERREKEDEEEEEEDHRPRRDHHGRGRLSEGSSIPQESFSTPLRTSLGVSTSSPKSMKTRLSTSGQRFESPSSRLHSFLIGSKSYSVSTPLSGTSGAKTPFGRYHQLFRHMERQQEVRYRTVSDMVQSSQTQVTECLGLCDSLLARVDQVRNDMSRSAIEKSLLTEIRVEEI